MKRITVALLTLLAVLGTGGCFTPSPQSQALIDRAQQQTQTPVPTHVSGDSGTPLSPGEIPGSVSQKLSQAEIEELRQFALQLVNKDRADHGLPPVVLGSNEAAQAHAEDMLDHDYLGHWWTDGRKPYMVYTQTGGTTYSSENAASGGWTAAKWESSNCDSLFVDCELRAPRDQIVDFQWGMVYHDAHADWGHRDNILTPGHRAVSIGVAWNGRRTTFAQHFEGGGVAADGPPTLTSDGTLSFSMSKLEPGVAVANVVSIYYDPLPTPKTPAQIADLHSYCLGGGFTTECVESAASVLEPPPRGSFYSNLGVTDFVADAWQESSTHFDFIVNAAYFRDPGVYSVVVWRDTGEALLSDSFVELSAFQY